MRNLRRVFGGVKNLSPITGGMGETLDKKSKFIRVWFKSSNILVLSFEMRGKVDLIFFEDLNSVLGGNV